MLGRVAVDEEDVALWHKCLIELDALLDNPRVDNTVLGAREEPHPVVAQVGQRVDGKDCLGIL